MHYDYVDIGTSNWGTSCDLITKTNKPQILLVEPVAHYLDQLPVVPHVTKCCAAVGGYDGQSQVYYIPEDVIRNQLPADWGFLDGCNSVGDYHPTQRDVLLKKTNLGLDTVKIDPVEMLTFSSLCARYSIKSIGRLKIDTEGHEVHILPGVLEMVQHGLVIENIEFEYAFSNPSQHVVLNDVADQLESLGYERYWVSNLDGTPGSNDMGLKKIHK